MNTTRIDFSIYIVLNEVAMPDGDNFFSITSIVPCTHKNPEMAQRFVNKSDRILFANKIGNADIETAPLEYSIYLYNLSLKLADLLKICYCVEEFFMKSDKLINKEFQAFYAQRETMLEK